MYLSWLCPPHTKWRDQTEQKQTTQNLNNLQYTLVHQAIHWRQSWTHNYLNDPPNDIMQNY